MNQSIINLNVVFFLLLPLDCYAGKGKELPLNERAEYYKQKYQEQSDPDKKTHYKKKYKVAVEKIEHITAVSEAASDEKDFLKGEASLLKCTTKEQETWGYVCPNNESVLRNFLKYRVDTDGLGFREMGEIYAKAGGHFKVVTMHAMSPDDAMNTTNSYHYALKVLSGKLEGLTGISLEEILKMSDAYSLSHILDLYFDIVKEPLEGDLVVYESLDNTHAGICKFADDNSLVVESWWRRGRHSSIFEHDIFFLPAHKGNKARCYRVKAKLETQVQDKLVDVPLMAKPREDGVFVFEGTQENRNIREFITKFSLSSIELKYPDLFKEKKSIRFSGVCYGYAMGRVFGTLKRPAVVPYFEGNAVGTREFLHTYFELTTKPQKGDLVIYYKWDPIENPHQWTHFGEYIGNNLVDSKWGTGNACIHPLFFVDKMDGDFVEIWTKKLPAEEILARLKQENKKHSPIASFLQKHTSVRGK